MVFLPEAFDAARPIEPEIRERLEKIGYKLLEIAYGDRDDRLHSPYPATKDPHMMLLSRLKVERFEELSRVGGARNMLTADVVDPDTNRLVCIFGIHLDDRTEEKRLRQVDVLVPLIREATPIPVIAMGDFNAMRGDSLPAFIFGNRVSRAMSEYIPSKRIKDVAQRVSEMAIGDTIRMFEEGTGLVNADPRGRLTTTPKMRGMEFMPSIPMVKIDNLYVGREFTVRNERVEGDGGSDHRLISAELRLAA